MKQTEACATVSRGFLACFLLSVMLFNFKEMSGMLKIISTRMAIVSCLVASGITLQSCLPEALDVDAVPVIKPQIVVSTQIFPAQGVVVLLTKTFGALDANDDSDPLTLLSQIAVNDAVVTIDGPAGLHTLDFLATGTYGDTSITFAAGEEYHLHVSSEELGEVRATTRVKPMVAFSEIDAELFYNGFDDTLAQITYTFEDSVENNWYMINVQEVEREDVIENLLNPRAYTILIDDADFNGESYGEQVRVWPRDYKSGDTIAVSLSNISEEYFRFMQLRLDNRFSFVEFISEPVNYPSNVVGGRGYFNLYIPDARIFVFE
jgi:hypothetical protein